MREILLGNSVLIYQVGGRAMQCFPSFWALSFCGGPIPWRGHCVSSLAGISLKHNDQPARSRERDSFRTTHDDRPRQIYQKEKLPTIGPNSVRLAPLEQILIYQIADAPLAIDHFPFLIERKSANKYSCFDGPVALILQDRRPFRLSRRYLFIGQEDGLFDVCGHRNFHGAIVSGIALAASGGGQKGPFDLGGMN